MFRVPVGGVVTSKQIDCVYVCRAAREVKSNTDTSTMAQSWNINPHLTDGSSRPTLMAFNSIFVTYWGKKEFSSISNWPGCHRTDLNK